MADIIEFDIPEHEAYKGSYEAENRLPARPEQDWTSSDINLLRDVLASFYARLGQVGDVDDLTGEYESLVEAINGILSGSTGDIGATLTELESKADTALQDAADADSKADTAAQTAAGASTLATQAINAATSAVAQINALVDPIYGSIVTQTMTINDALVNGRELFKLLVDTTAGDVTITMDDDLSDDQELIINRLYGSNDLMVLDGSNLDIDFYGEDADPLTLNYRGWVHLKKTASGWITVDHRATDSAAA